MFFHVIFHVVLQKKCWKIGFVWNNMLFWLIADICGTYQGILNFKCSRNINLEWLHLLWQVIQNHNFAKSREKPHKLPISNWEVQPPTLNFWSIFLARMVPYGSKNSVPGFPYLFSWKVGFVKHSNEHVDSLFDLKITFNVSKYIYIY